MTSEREKMAAGDWYCCLDPELDALRNRARAACHAHNTLSPEVRGAMALELRALLGQVAESAYLEAPFHCSYGFNIVLGQAVYLNAGCTILDNAPVVIGDRCMLGPSVQIYCADHHRDADLRRRGIERARPVTLGSDVWIGGGAILLGGISVGEGAIVGAGSVVTRDVAAHTTVAGNPARPVNRRD